MRERQIRSASGEAIARAQLNRLTGAPLDRAFDVAEPAVAPAALPTPEAAEKTALTERATVKRTNLQVALAQAAQSAARSAFLPQVVAQGVYEWNGQRVSAGATSWMAGVQARWNVFAGFGDRARLRASNEAAARAAAEREDALNAIRVEVRSARAELEGATAREALGRAAVLQARESQRIVRDRYEAGLAGVTDILRAANALLESESLRTAAIADVIVSQAVLDRATGRR